MVNSPLSNTGILLLSVHRVGLAGACLAIGKDAGVDSFVHHVLNGGLHKLVHVILRSLGIEYLLEAVDGQVLVGLLLVIEDHRLSREGDVDLVLVLDCKTLVVSARLVDLMRHWWPDSHSNTDGGFHLKLKLINIGATILIKQNL